MNLLRQLAAALAASAAMVAFAHTDMTLAVPPRAQLVSALNLDAQRARTVAGILDTAQARLNFARSQIGAANDDRSRLALLSAVLLIRYETDVQLATVLTPDEFARLKETVYPAGWVRGLPRGTPM